MEKSVNFFEFSDPSEGMQGVINLEPEKKKPEIIEQPSASSPSKSALDSYKGFCDVDTAIVLYRIKKTLWPFDRSKFLESKADLYGAFWIPTTLICILSVAGSIGAKYSDNQFVFNPSDIVLVTGVVYFFVLTVPSILSFILLAGYEITYTELLSLYGYSYFLFCPAAVISVINYSLVRWLAFSVASVWAGVLLTKNYYNELEFLEGGKKYLAIGISLSGYVGLTLTANLYLFK